MNYPKITIIIPIYNTQKFLKKCIGSVINQTYKNLEIILINDGSTDNSLKLCKYFQEIDERIIVLNKNNEGVSAARNLGLDIASGDYIGFVDSDDYISEYMYEKMIYTAIESNADVIECGYFSCDENNRIIRRHELNESIIKGNYNCIYNYLSQENTTNFNWNKLYKKSLFDNIRYPNFSYSEDYWVNAKIFYKCNKKITLKECLYFYVQNKNSAVNKPFNFEKRKDTLKAGIDLYNYYQKIHENLCEFIALYICNYVLEFYFMIGITKNNKKYLIELNKIFKQYAPKIRSNGLKSIKFSRKSLYIKLFKINPKIYFLIRYLFKILKKEILSCKNLLFKRS